LEAVFSTVKSFHIKDNKGNVYGSFEPPFPSEVRFDVPITNIDDEMSLNIIADGASSPYKENMSDDTRELGVGIKDVAVIINNKRPIFRKTLEERYRDWKIKKDNAKRFSICFITCTL
jgi:hypothetical protein